MRLLDEHQLHGYQQRIRRHIVDHPYAMVVAEMGLGKTVSTLSAIVDLFNRLETRGVLVVGTRRIIESVWRQEAAKWAHTRHLTFSSITGTREQRLRALFIRSQIYLVSYDNLSWLQEEIEQRFLRANRYPPFDMVVWDEVSKLKHARTRQGTARGKAALKLLPYLRRRVGLTGTPSSNGLRDLFGQYLVLDGGERLGTSYTAYERQYFYYPDPYSRTVRLLPNAREAILRRVGDITVSLRSADYIQLPPMQVIDVPVALPPQARDRYRRMEKEMFLEFDSGAVLDIENAASLSNRCLQMANGACYTEVGGPWEEQHRAKLDALEDILEEAAGQPVLLAYQFRHDAERILKRFPDARRLKSDMPEAEFLGTIEAWNRGEVPLLIGHPDSIGHGINLQAGGNLLVWFGLTWRRDLYDQMNARLHRQGQQKPVFVYRILANDTMDEVVRDVLENKGAEEDAWKQAIQSYRRRKGL